MITGDTLMWTRRGVIALLPAGLLIAAIAPPSADSLLDAAKNEANGRAIFATFHASWCGWCRKLDTFLESEEIKPIIGKYFVIAHFTVQEIKEKKELNTPGGEELMKRLGGPAGLPFYAFLDTNGAVIVNSIMDKDAGKPGTGGNIGHPAEPAEIDWFMTMLAKAAPAMTAEERGTIEKWLRSQKR